MNWRPCIVGESEYGWEVSICRESFPHGFISLGWDDRDVKIILFEVKRGRANGEWITPKPLWDVLVKFKEQFLVDFAQRAAEAMNDAEKKEAQSKLPHGDLTRGRLGPT